MSGWLSSTCAPSACGLQKLGLAGMCAFTQLLVCENYGYQRNVIVREISWYRRLLWHLLYMETCVMLSRVFPSTNICVDDFCVDEFCVDDFFVDDCCGIICLWGPFLCVDVCLRRRLFSSTTAVTTNIFGDVWYTSTTVCINDFLQRLVIPQRWKVDAFVSSGRGIQFRCPLRVPLEKQARQGNKSQRLQPKTAQPQATWGVRVCVGVLVCVDVCVSCARLRCFGLRRGW